MLMYQNAPIQLELKHDAPVLPAETVRTTYRLADYPEYRPIEAYDRHLRDAARVLRGIPGLLGMYQLGSIRHPGISDIDVMAVFDDRVRVQSDPFMSMSADCRYYFTHRIMGLTRKDFLCFRRFSFFSLRPLHEHEALSATSDPMSDADISVLEVQTALEYLVKLYVNLTVRRTYGMIRVRQLLLLANAVKFDLAFLGIENGPLHAYVRRLVSWREDWFEATPDPAEITAWLEGFYDALEALLKRELSRRPLYAIRSGECHPSRHIRLVPSDGFAREHRGIGLPAWTFAVSDRAYSVLNRINRFTFRLPITTEDVPDVLVERFHCIRSLEKNGSDRLPAFLQPHIRLGLC